MIGVSQGGLNARHVLEICGLKAKVRNFITLGTPNMGLTEVGRAFSDPTTVQKLDEFAYQYGYYTIVQFAAAAAGYFRDTRSSETYQNYLDYSWFLARLNNENDHTSNAALERKEKVTSLNNWLAVCFQQDGIVAPWQSACFADLQVPDVPMGQRTLVPMQES